MSQEERYDYRGCQSLFGYAQTVHERSGGICQLCDAGAGPDPSFDLWRQLTVEHLIGTSQGGDYRQILQALQRKFPETACGELEERAEQLENANMVSACAFCNSTTSRDRHEVSMGDLIFRAGNTWSDVLASVQVEAQKVLEQKRADVAWKLASIREQYEGEVRSKLQLSRRRPRAT